MKIQKSREIRFASYPHGLPTEANFTLASEESAPLESGQVRVRNLFLSVDPYMRGRMTSRKSYIPPFETGKVMDGGAVGEVVESQAAEFQAGDVVTSNFGWRETFTAPPDALHKVSRDVQPLSAYLGILGMTGMTAWAGLRLVDVQKADTIYISGAAGAVGSVAGQLAKLRGCRVVGSAGSAEKVRFLVEECGFDAAFNYKSGPIAEQLQFIQPDGIDVYFDNVGGESLEAALSVLRVNGRIIACGGISSYNAEEARPGPTNLFNITVKRLTMTGMIVTDFMGQQAEFEKEVGGYFKEGKLKNKETVVKGIENAAAAFIGLFHGENTGKMIVDVS